MELTKQHRATTRRVQVRRMTAAAVAVFGLSALVLAPEAAQASSHTTKSVVISTAKNSKYGTILVVKRPYSLHLEAEQNRLWRQVPEDLA